MKEKILALALSVFVSVSTASGEDVENGNTIVVDGRRCALTFEDNFDGTELDPGKWERCPEQKRQDLNNYWDDDMSYLDGEGNLIIGMEYDSELDHFNSGAVRSKGRFEQAYGYYEIRCTINTVPGYWTAFWLMNDCVMSESNGGKDGTEIDIFESPYCDKKKIQHTLNWDGYGVMHKALGNVVDADVYDGEYHTFALLWTEEEYVYYIDGKETWRTDAEKARGTCEKPLFVKISAETGSWTGKPRPEDLPDIMKVDYVRVYQFV
ncbi:MAG: family 16 glycosylhydrolase [Huintestinicola sp.]